MNKYKIQQVHLNALSSNFSESSNFLYHLKVIQKERIVHFATRLLAMYSDTNSARAYCFYQ